MHSVRAIGRMAAMSLAQHTASKGSSGDFLGKMSSISNKFAKDSGLGSTLGTLMAGVRNILPVSQSLPITRITESIMDGTLSAGGGSSIVLGGSGGQQLSDDDYLFLDPRAAAVRGGGDYGKTMSKATRNMVFQEGYVFVVGGGNYVEYQSLQDWAQVCLFYSHCGVLCWTHLFCESNTGNPLRTDRRTSSTPARS